MGKNMAMIKKRKGARTVIKTNTLKMGNKYAKIANKVVVLQI